MGARQARRDGGGTSPGKRTKISMIPSEMQADVNPGVAERRAELERWRLTSTDRDMPKTTATDLPDQLEMEVLLDIRDLQAITGLGPSAIYSRIAKNEFPAPVRLSSRCSRWKKSRINAWLESL